MLVHTSVVTTSALRQASRGSRKTLKQSVRFTPAAAAGVTRQDCLKTFSDPLEACRGAHVVTTDVWTSMGYEAENEARRLAFADWCVGPAMMAAAQPDALFMHCLPAHRGEEVDAAVIDGPQSVVWDEAENRLHVQKALMEFLVLGRIG